MKTREFLARRPQGLVSCRPGDSLAMAAQLLTKHNIGAMPVIDAFDRLAGIISERDLVRAFSRQGFDIRKLTVGDIMTREVATCGLDDEVISTRKLMKQYGCRHVPVVDAGRVLGIISIRDTLECRLEDQQAEVNVLRDTVVAARYR